MAENNQNYSNLDEPYNNYMERQNTPFGSLNSDPNVNAGSGIVSDPADVDAGNLDGQLLDNLRIDSWIKSRGFQPKKRGFYLDGKTGYAEFADIFSTGTIVSTGGTIGGFEIGSDYIRDTANTMGIASTVTNSDDIRFWAGSSFLNRATAPFRVTESGALFIGSLVWTKITILTSFESLDGWSQTVGIGSSADIRIGSLQLIAGATAQMAIRMAGILVIRFTKNPIFQTLLQFTSTTTQTAWFGMGVGSDTTSDSFGFHVVNGTLTTFTQHANNITETTVTATLTNQNIYRAEMTSGTKVDFYINGTLVSTHTANLPTSTSNITGMYYEINSTAASTRKFTLANMLFSYDI